MTRKGNASTEEQKGILEFGPSPAPEARPLPVRERLFGDINGGFTRISSRGLLGVSGPIGGGGFLLPALLRSCIRAAARSLTIRASMRPRGRRQPIRLIAGTSQ